VTLDHNFGGADKLRLDAPDPSGYRLLVFYSSDWDRQRRGNPHALAATGLDAAGRWLQPVELGPGVYHLVATRFRACRILAMYLTVE
jgi:hypothetical protein